jgi:hypothetical protein
VRLAGRRLQLPRRSGAAVTAAQAHPNILGAVAALHTLATGWQWLAALLEPGTPIPTGSHMSPATRARLGRLSRAERADLSATLRRGLTPAGTGCVPVVLAVLQAQVAAHDTMLDAAWLVSSALRGERMLAFTVPAGGDDARVRQAVGYLAVGLKRISPDLADDIGGDLDKVGQQVAAVTGGRPNAYDLRGAGASCPACGGRWLVARTFGTDDATVGCERPGGCRCYGLDCGCRRPGRTPGLKHIWPAAEFEQLDRLLVRQGVAA